MAEKAGIEVVNNGSSFFIGGVINYFLFFKVLGRLVFDLIFICFGDIVEGRVLICNF